MSKLPGILTHSLFWWKRALFLNCILLATLTFTWSSAQSDPEPTRGGILDVAQSAEPGMLDIQSTTATITAIIASHWLETLVAFDENYVPQPHLAERITVNDDATRYTFHLREGIQFHNGTEMTAEDVAASLRRWSEVSIRGSVVAPYLEDIVVQDPYTLEVVLNEPFSPLLALLAGNQAGAAIYPEEIIERYGAEPIGEHIGTGPYKFVEWLPDQYIRIERFEEYQPVEMEPSGAAGRRNAYFDEIRFRVVPEDAIRIAGVQTGEYDFATDVASDAYTQVANDSRVDTVIKAPDRWPLFAFNKAQGIMQNKQLRQAFNAALNMEQILIATAGIPEFWNLDHNLMKGNTPWRCEAGSDVYNVANVERARELLQEAGYNGEPIRWIVSSAHHDHFMSTQAAVAQLQEAGFVVDLQPMEWPRLLEVRARQDLWDVFTTTGDFIPDPVLFVPATERMPGWWVNEERDQLLSRLNSEPTREGRLEAWCDLQALIYEELPFVVVGDIYGLNIKQPDLHGFVPFGEPFFWNTWRE